jgi:glycosyltransferase involved in cell wall biosynthesis
VQSAMERYWGVASRPLGRLMEGAGLDVPIAMAASAYGGLVRTLQASVAEIRADLYIAHYIAALPAAAAAAERQGAMLGFDAEDFHSGEGIDTAQDAFRMRMVERVERQTVRRCAHLTAASPLIAKAYAAKYGASPITILNVFPVDMAPREPVAEPSGPLRAYWFSQTIGLDRGLQTFLQAMAQARGNVTLDVRGDNRWGHGNKLLEMARELGVGGRVRLLPMASPDEMVRLAAEYDIGLSLETDVTENRRLCLTNKIFTYLLAGVPVLMSDTPAQCLLAPELGAAARVVALSEPQAVAAAIDEFANPSRRAEAKATAWRLGRERYNWDVEKKVFLRSIAEAFEGHGHA